MRDDDARLPTVELDRRPPVGLHPERSAHLASAEHDAQRHESFEAIGLLLFEEQPEDEALLEELEAQQAELADQANDEEKLA